MRFVSFAECRPTFLGKSVAIVGSGPGCLKNEPGFIDKHDVVVRINNYKTGEHQGYRCDVFYSFFGTSIQKKAYELHRDGVRLMMCKLPNSRPIESAWHERMHKLEGIDYRYVYRNRARWWFCNTFVPDDAHFLRKFELLHKHQPTTGFAAILDVLMLEPKSVYLTGFDGFASGIHNVNEKWRVKNSDDPIGHAPECEIEWIARNEGSFPITVDPDLDQRLARWRQVAVA